MVASDLGTERSLGDGATAYERSRADEFVPADRGTGVAPWVATIARDSNTPAMARGHGNDDDSAPLLAVTPRDLN